MSPDVRTLDESDLPEWLRALNNAFLQPQTVAPEEVTARRPAIDLDRTQGVFDEGRCVATFRSMPRELTVPGGAQLAACAVTNVSVTATHRRRGLASRMMSRDLTAAKERGEAVSILIAAEYPIYGRYGYGPATWTTAWDIDVPRAGLDRRWAGPTDGGRVDLLTTEEVRKTGPELHERVRRLTPGAINRIDRWWDMETGQLILPSRPWKEPFFVAYRDSSGRLDGLATYSITDHRWPGKFPKVTLEADKLIAVSPAAETALWRFLLSVDWVTELRTGLRAPDDIVPLLLGDPRAAKVETYADFMWLRILDTPRALEARTYSGAGSLVLDLSDEAGLAGGRYRLETDANGNATCRPTRDAAELSLGIAELGTLYLGDESVLRLAALGRVTEDRSGAASRADALFRTPRRPWNPDIF
ncbi:GNAT family N-acetyltransferase [Streptomyces sp. H10-C2]|uniref:GNAT family N-acetyltransferase n=1 Tax=unclassified Streptomyces TaxID=2593676 RepID=UPI0024B8EDCF|nr:MULTISPECIES: GNAT family N-acetyltransferase [unclassified Streptomyces]MDJ0345074.1 GNAT family N-acetyltransferase [Streptomyces sp. PH10-H1]MDJ0373979.1 GNAT family N-acetyltransferase [Streptomyces sp. H10-C2]